MLFTLSRHFNSLNDAAPCTQSDVRKSNLSHEIVHPYFKVSTNECIGPNQKQCAIVASIGKQGGY